MKKNGVETMEILEAFDRTGCAHSAAGLVGCDPKTVRRLVARRGIGLGADALIVRPRLVDAFTGVNRPGASLTVRTDPPLVTDGDDLPADQPVRYIYRDAPDCDTPVLGPLDGSVWRLADQEAPWDVRDGDELTLYPLGGSDSEMISSAPHMDWLFVRLPQGRDCP